MRWDPAEHSRRLGPPTAEVAVAVISKLPRLGRSKTRLARSLGPEAALDLHRAFLQDELLQLDRPQQWQLYLVHDPTEGEPDRRELARLLDQRVTALAPGLGDLSAELHGAFTALLERHSRAIVVSGDVPHLDAAVVAEALAALDDADVVLGIGPDGGYYLVGLKANHDIFTPVAMSTERTVQATLAHARHLGLRVAQVGRLTDMDEAQDLLTLADAPAEVAGRTRAVLADLRRNELAVALPSELQIEVTSRCNLRCSACKRTHTQLAADADLTLADFHDIVAELPRLERVVFQLNGEPFMCRDLPAMIAAATAMGAWSVVNTNGTLLDGPRRAAVLASGLRELRVSIDAITPAIARRMVGALVLDKVVANVRALVRERGDAPWPRVSLWQILTKETVTDLPALVRLAADLGVEEVYGQRLVLTGDGVATKALSLHARVDDRARALVQQAEALADELGITLRGSGRRPILESLTPSQAPNPWLACWRPWRSAVVTASRQVLPCCISSFVLGYDELTLGDLKTEDWRTIYNGPRYRALRRGLLAAEPMPSCQGCTRDWSL